MNADGGQPILHEPADIVLTATVKADELRFDEAPQTHVEFSGRPGHESGSGSDRTNLPDRVEENITYRHVQVDYVLASTLTIRS
ncbi:hypothetical protein [Nonomuraea sp. NPDC049141]|uniref:hypothetical protein n=1 Tax=Nonomuraea sp. NPDC049141 TaxID=3155500 RepID=UPI003411D55C